VTVGFPLNPEKRPPLAARATGSQNHGNREFGIKHKILCLMT